MESASKDHICVLGTFGQPDAWDIHNPATYQHPMVPYDVLIDPLSLPEHPVIDGRQNLLEVVHADSARNSGSEDEEEKPQTAATHVPYGRQQYYIDDDTIAKMLAQRPQAKGSGKR